MSYPPPIARIVISVVVIDQSEFGIAVFTAPLEGLDGAAAGCDFAIGGVGVGGADVAIGAEHFADVLCQIPAVAVPCAAFLDDQWAGGDGLGRIPCDEP